MRHGSLFSGIGGFDLAAEWMGWENLFHCEMNPFGQKVLNHYWPNAELFTDITKSDFTKYANRIDILTGGFPCQPYSHAGKRLGKEDERHLWPEMLRAIREIRPTWVVGENVSGLISWNGGLVFHEVQTDLEAEGYEVQPFVLPACAVNAPHRRDRVWFIAYRNGLRGRQEHELQQPKVCKQYGKGGHTPNAASDRRQWTGQGVEIENGEQKPGKSGELAGRFEGLCSNATTTNSSNEGLQGSKVNGSTGSIRQERNKQFAGCVPPTWNQFPTQPPVCSRNDGLPAGLVGITVSKHRNESIKAYGNAIVPQVALQIFKAIAYL